LGGRDVLGAGRGDKYAFMVEQLQGDAIDIPVTPHCTAPCPFFFYEGRGIQDDTVKPLASFIGVSEPSKGISPFDLYPILEVIDLDISPQHLHNLA